MIFIQENGISKGKEVSVNQIRVLFIFPKIFNIFKK